MNEQEADKIQRLTLLCAVRAPLPDAIKQTLWQAATQENFANTLAAYLRDCLGDEQNINELLKELS
jgi:hypothetical protein